MKTSVVLSAKQWFAGLAERDQRALLLLAAVVAPIVLWKIVWVPIAAEKHKQQALYEQASSDLQWMQKGNQCAASELNADGALEYIKTGAQARNLIFLEEPVIDHGSITLNFESVNFNELAAWLYEIEAQKGIEAVNVALKLAGSHGFVSGTIVLKL